MVDALFLVQPSAGQCPACGGDLVNMGSLGRRNHFRCRECGLDSSTVEPEEPKKTRPKVRIKVRSKFDRAGGAVDGEFVFDKETGKVTVREKGAKTAYSIGMAELCEFICRRGMGLAR